MNTPINNDWTSLVPPFDPQYSQATHTDVDDCVEESLSHIIYCLTGFRPSARALAKMSGVTLQGSDTFSALSAVNQHGLIPYQEWPTPTDFDWNGYYATLSPEALSWTLPAMVKTGPVDLSKSPSWTRIVFPNGAAHFVCQINSHQYFDSELNGSIKELTYGGAIVTSSMGIQISDNFFLKSAGFEPAQLANMPADIVAAIKENDNGAKNIILNDKILIQTL